MLHAPLCILSLFLCGQPVAKIRDIPVPTFTQRVDYVEWVVRVARGTGGPETDAADDYDAILATVERPADGNWVNAFGLNGPLTDTSKGLVDRTEPWNPADHPEWEEAHHRAAPLREKFLAAATKPTWLYSVKHARTRETECTSTLFDIPPQFAHAQTMLARAMIDAAWRAPDGKVDLDAFTTMMRANLGLVRQLERDPVGNVAQSTLGLRGLTYYSIMTALRTNLFNAGQRETLVRTLAESDVALPSFEYLLAGEKAALFDLIQAAAEENAKPPCGPRGKRLAGLVRDGKTNPAELARTAEHYFNLMLDRASRPYTADFLTELERLQSGLRKSAPELAPMMAPMAKLFVFNLRMEAQRRALRCIAELHAYRDKHERWPASLNDLPTDVVREFTTDPFSGKPFGYKVDGDAFTIYSVAQDATDNNGVHDPRWADREAGGDYVFWSGNATQK